MAVDVRAAAQDQRVEPVARIARQGRDLTIVSAGQLVHRSLEAAAALARYLALVQDEAKARGLKVQATRGLLECDFGDWTGSLLKDLFKQFERQHDSITYAQKQVAIQQVLDSSSGELDALYARLSKLADTWEASNGSDAPAAQLHGQDTHKIVPALDNSDAALRDLFASTLEGVVGSLLISAPELREEAHDYSDAGMVPVWRRLPELREKLFKVL